MNKKFFRDKWKFSPEAFDTDVVLLLLVERAEHFINIASTAKLYEDNTNKKMDTFEKAWNYIYKYRFTSKHYAKKYAKTNVNDIKLAKSIYCDKKIILWHNETNTQYAKKIIK